MIRFGNCPNIMVNKRKTGHLKWMDWDIFYLWESSIIWDPWKIPLISTLTRASVYYFCLKSVLQATLVAAVVIKDLIVGNLISSKVPPCFTFMYRCNGLWLDDCSILCLLICLANILVHSVLYSLQPQKKLLSVERFLHSHRRLGWASTSTQKVGVGFYLNRLYRGPKVMWK